MGVGFPWQDKYSPSAGVPGAREGLRWGRPATPTRPSHRLGFESTSLSEHVVSLAQVAA